MQELTQLALQIPMRHTPFLQFLNQFHRPPDIADVDRKAISEGGADFWPEGHQTRTGDASACRSACFASLEGQSPGDQPKKLKKAEETFQQL